MSRLIRFSENGMRVWARVDLDDGAPVLICLEKAGVVVIKLKTGFCGRLVFKQSAVAWLVELCLQTECRLQKFAVSDKMKNPVLRVLAQLALDSISIEDYIARLECSAHLYPQAA